MKKLLVAAHSLLLLFVCNPALSQNDPHIGFVENKGQWDKKVKFKGEINGGAFFLTAKGFTAVKHKAEDWERLTKHFHSPQQTANTAGTGKRAQRSAAPLIVRSHAYKVSFVRAADADVAGEEVNYTYNNYFIGNDPAKWASKCRIYKAITYRNIYPNIDVRYYTDGGHLKYDIVVKPGANPDDLALRYDDADGLQLKNEQLIVHTSAGQVKELAPYTYQTKSGRPKQVACRFKVTGNVVKFALGSYSKNATLVIDPEVVFSSFTGSTADNWGYTATYGPDGSFFAGGIVFANGYPTTTGAYQTTFNGGYNNENTPGHDVGIIKFNAGGTNREYATYIGGGGNEQPHSLVVDALGNLVIAGRTSSPNYPSTFRDVGRVGDYDIFLTKLNSSGTAILGSRKIGGSASDGVNVLPKYVGNGTTSIRRNYGDDARSEVILDNENNIYLASCTQSVDFPITAGAFQVAHGGTSGRAQDGILLKTSPDVSTVIFSSFLGGNNDDAAFVLALHPRNKNIYVGGSTISADFPGRNNGAVINSTYQGGECDGYVSVISNDGSTLISSTYIGTSGNDMLYGLQLDQAGFPYVLGTTTITFPVINATFSQEGGKQFVSKLSPDLSTYVYSTNFGTNSPLPNISPVAFFVDACERVYVSGWGGEVGPVSDYASAGTIGLSVTPDAIKSTTDGKDFYFIVLEQNAASLVYGSFFGQVGGLADHVDGGTSRFNKDGTLYLGICANCGRDVPFPVTPGAWATTNGSDQCNQAAVKIAFNSCAKAFATNYWLGAIDTSWHNPLNWSSGIVPTENVDAVINPGSPFNCVVNRPAVCRTLTLTPGGRLNTNSNLTVMQ